MSRTLRQRGGGLLGVDSNVVRIDADAGDVDKEELVVTVEQPGRPEVHPFGEINLACIEIVERRVLFAAACCEVDGAHVSS